MPKHQPISAITGRERILAAFRHEKTDRLPVFDALNNPRIFTETLGKENFWSDGELTIQASRALGLDAALVPVGAYTALISRAARWLDTHRFIDRFGVEYTVNDSSWPLGFATREIPLDEALLDQLEKASRTSPLNEDELQPIREACRHAHTGGSDEIAVFGGIRSAFSFLSISGGLTALSIMVYENPKLLKALAEAADTWWTRAGLQLIDAGVDALYAANDMGMNRSTLISPAHLREFFLPTFNSQCSRWKAAGGRVILHSCGNIAAILPDIAASGAVDGITNLQTAAGMDLEQVKRDYGSQWTIIGNVDATTIMTSTSQNDITQAVAEVIRIAADGGGLILATDHSFHKGIPVENVRFFIQEAKRLGRVISSETTPSEPQADSEPQTDSEPQADQKISTDGAQ